MVSFSIEVESKEGRFITVISKEKWYNKDAQRIRT